MSKKQLLELLIGQLCHSYINFMYLDGFFLRFLTVICNVIDTFDFLMQKRSWFSKTLPWKFNL